MVSASSISSQQDGARRSAIPSQDLCWSVSFGLDVSAAISSVSSETSCFQRRQPFPLVEPASFEVCLGSSWLTEVCPVPWQCHASTIWRQRLPLLLGDKAVVSISTDDFWR